MLETRQCAVYAEQRKKRSGLEPVDEVCNITCSYQSPTATTTPNVFEHVATEASSLAAYNKKSTVSSREMICELKVCRRGAKVMLAIRTPNARNGYPLTTL